MALHECFESVSLLLFYRLLGLPGPGVPPQSLLIKNCLKKINSNNDGPLMAVYHLNLSSYQIKTEGREHTQNTIFKMTQFILPAHFLGTNYPRTGPGRDRVSVYKRNCFVCLSLWSGENQSRHMSVWWGQKGLYPTSGAPGGPTTLLTGFRGHHSL